MKPRRLHYDLILPMGMACSCSQSLRRANLQYLSFPFDWFGLPKGKAVAGHEFTACAEMVRNRFDRFLELEDFDYLGEHTNGKSKFHNRHTGLTFLHDFPGGVPIAESIGAIQEKYARRRARLYRLLGTSKRILLCRLDRPDIGAYTSLSDCRAARQIFTDLCPHATVEVLLLQCNPTVPFAERRLETPEDGLYRLVFDYRATDPSVEPQFPDLVRTADALAALLAVRDYRTVAERRAFARKRRLAKWRKYGATTRLGYLWNRLFKGHLR